MGRIVIVKNFARALREGVNISDVITDSGGGVNVTGEHYADAGDDSYPLSTDYAITVNTQRTGGEAVVGYADVINTPKALAGDKRIYSRDANGDSVAEVWLKADSSVTVQNANGSVVLAEDGSISASNGSGSMVLLASGNVNINGAVIDTAGNITSPGTIVAVTSVSAPAIIGGASVAAPSIAAGGVEMAGHAHSQGNDSGSDVQVNTNAAV